MTIQPSSILKTLVLAGLVLQPLTAGAQGSRTSTSTPRPAPAPAPRTTVPSTPAPAPATTPATTSPAAPSPTAAARIGGAVATSYTPSESEYRLGAGDKLRIEVYREAQLSQALQIRPDGKITLPLVGDIAAAGRTPLELRDAVAAALREYVTNPVVTVIVQEATANKIFIIGEVATPGEQVLIGPMTALQALAQAGGLKEFAKANDIHVLRKTGNTTRTLKFDYKGALKGKVDPMPLQPGDTIVVP
jgi:polysaccharide export outer membrane protein